MRALLFSMLLYLFGVALVLFFRPQFMFYKDGRWKEFGVGYEGTTVFPFWMFCIAWAVFSYAIGRTFFGLATVAASRLSEDNAVEPLPVNVASSAIGSSGSAEASSPVKPGYYKLNSNASRKKGAPRYVYVGTELPDDME
jgi:lysylphosphatidylglycerol synthetase-like protein (DUF2156 family)